jgi:hypothetical protein
MSEVVEDYFHLLRNDSMEPKAFFEMQFKNIHSLVVTG